MYLFNFLHLNSWNKYIFDVLGAGLSQNGQKLRFIKTHFLNTESSPIWAEMAEKMLRDPPKISYKSWHAKNFHGNKN